MAQPFAALSTLFGGARCGVARLVEGCHGTARLVDDLQSTAASGSTARLVQDLQSTVEAAKEARLDEEAIVEASNTARRPYVESCEERRVALAKKVLADREVAFHFVNADKIRSCDMGDEETLPEFADLVLREGWIEEHTLRRDEAYQDMYRTAYLAVAHRQSWDEVDTIDVELGEVRRHVLAQPIDAMGVVRPLVRG